MPQEPTAPYISTIEAAKRHGMTHDHVGLLCRRAKVQGILVGRQWYVNEDSLIEYIQKNSAIKEARKRQLSQQWRAAWTAVFMGLSVFGFGAHEADAKGMHIVYAKDYVPPVDASPLSFENLWSTASGNLSAAAASLPEPKIELKPIETRTFLTGENLLAGVAVANETLRDINDGIFAMYVDSVKQFVAYAKFDAQQFAFVADRTFGEFGRRYMGDIDRLGDAQVSLYVAGGNALDSAYNKVGDALDAAPRFDRSISVASVDVASPDLVAAVGDTVSGVWNGAVDKLSNIFVDIAAGSNVLIGSLSEKTAAITPTNVAPQKTSAKPTVIGYADFPAEKSAQVLAPSSSQAPLAVALPTYIAPTTRVGLAEPEQYVSQDSLNNQFAAWILVIKALIAGDTGYVNNPEVAALGNGGGSTVNNYYSLSQRIDQLDGVTLTNSSINGVSDFSHLGGASALTDLSDTLVASPAYGNLLMYNGSKWVNTATSSLGIAGVAGSVGNWFTPAAYGNSTSTTIGFTNGLLSVGSTTINGNATTTGNFDIGGSTAGSNKLVLNGINGSSVFNQEISHSISGQASTLLFKLNHGSLPASNETNTVRFYGGNTSLEAVNENDSLGVKFAESFSTAFMGLTSTGGASGSVPAGGFLLSFAISNAGKVGSVSGMTSYASPNWRNVLDDGSGNLTTSGKVGVATSSPWGQLSVNSTAGVPQFVIGSSTATQFIVDKSGNVGIGTTSPYAKLSVVGEIVGSNLTATSTTATSTIAGGLNVGSGALTYDFSSGVTSINNAALGSFTFDTDAGIVSWADLPISSNASAGTVESYSANIGGNPLFTIYGEADGSGNAQNLRVGIGSTSPSAISGTAAYLTIDKSATAQYALMTFSTTTSSSVQVAFANGNGVVGTISTNGSATAYNTSSDRRIKGDIASTSLGLSQLMQIPVRDFDFLNDPAHATTTGFIAQELFKIFPYAVTTNGDDGMGALATGTLPWSVDYGRVTPLIVKAVQDIADITSNFKDNLIAWLSDPANGITRLFAKEVHTDKLCVGDTCVTQEQFMAMVAASGSRPSAPAPEAPVVETPDATSTPEVTPDASSTPEVTPEASSTPVVPDQAPEASAPIDASSTPAE